METTRAQTVLVIEDDESIAAELRALLEPEGYHVIVSDARLAARTLAARAEPCVVLFDPLLRGVTPSGLARRLRDHQTLLTLAVAIYPHQGRASNDEPRRAKRLVSPALLVQLVRGAFDDLPPDARTETGDAA